MEKSQLNNELVSSQSITINSTSDQIWETLTNPAFISQYLFGAETITDWKVGSEILFKIAVESTTFIDRGIVVEYKPSEFLKYKYWSGLCGLEDKPENYSLVTYHIQNLGQNKCSLTWTQKGFADEQSRSNSENSLSAILENIKLIAEKLNGA